MKKNWKDVELDDPSLWPTRKRVVLPKAHVDARGSIQSLVDLPMKNASLITSRKGTLRSNHYHKTSLGRLTTTTAPRVVTKSRRS